MNRKRNLFQNKLFDSGMVNEGLVATFSGGYLKNSSSQDTIYLHCLACMVYEDSICRPVNFELSKSFAQISILPLKQQYIKFILNEIHGYIKERNGPALCLITKHWYPIVFVFAHSVMVILAI